MQLDVRLSLFVVILAFVHLAVEEAPPSPPLEHQPAQKRIRLGVPLARHTLLCEQPLRECRWWQDARRREWGEGSGF